LAALLHGTLVVGGSQTLRRSTEGATYIRHGGYHVGHWPTFLVNYYSRQLCEEERLGNLGATAAANSCEEVHNGVVALVVGYFSRHWAAPLNAAGNTI